MYNRLMLFSVSQLSVGSAWQNLTFYTMLFAGFAVVVVQLNPTKETGVRRFVMRVFSGREFADHRLCWLKKWLKI
jgi:hypothetical protein